MLQIIARRLLVSIPLLFFVSMLTFFLVTLTPGDPAIVILGQNRAPEEYAALREQLGLNEPVLTRYGYWLRDLSTGSLGVSIFNMEPVTTVLKNRSGATFSLVIVTTIVTSVLGVALGMGSALQKGLLAKIVDLLSLLGLALPNFWLALVLVAIFSIGLHWFPAIGYVSPKTSVIDWLRSLALPVTVLSAPAIGIVAQQTRNAMLEILERPFIRTLRAGGVRWHSIIFRHALRNAAVSIITLVGLTFVGLLSGTVIAETVFALPGLGGLVVQATTRHDLPVIQGIVLYFTVIVVVVNLLVDIIYAWLNPRIRL
ncbi:MAG TPA: ABC transporter permease [Anaerolineaceae bacterium]|nr:ABC transporter permease [Anaerolineaceae bacterium]